MTYTSIFIVKKMSFNSYDRNFSIGPRQMFFFLLKCEGIGFYLHRNKSPSLLQTRAPNRKKNYLLEFLQHSYKPKEA